MKLGEIVTYPGLEGVSLCESISIECAWAQSFGGKAGSEVSMSSPRVCW